MYLGDDCGALAHGGGDALDGGGADVADREDAGAVGFEGLRGRLALGAGGAGDDEAGFVEFDAALQPVGVGIGADEQEDVAHVAVVRFAAIAVAVNGADESLLRVAFQFDQFGASVEFDVGQRGDAVDEVFRHGRFQAGAAHDQVQLLHLGREEDDGLPGGVAAADQRDLLAFAQARFHG
jgi:hypothetical protein